MTTSYSNDRLRNENVKTMIEEKYMTELSRSRRTLETFMEMLEVAEETKGELSTSQVVLHTLMVQSFNDFWGAILLCSHGYAFSASSQTRNIVNRLIDTKFIADGDSKPLAIRWIEFYHFQKNRYFINREKRGIPPTEITPEKRSEMETNAQKYIEKYGKGRHIDWSGMSIGAKAGEVGLDDIYHDLYSHLSNLAHSNVIGSEPYYMDDGGFRIGPQEESIGSTLDMTASTFMKQIQVWGDHRELDFEKQEAEWAVIWGEAE